MSHAPVPARGAVLMGFVLDSDGVLDFSIQPCMLWSDGTAGVPGGAAGTRSCGTEGSVGTWGEGDLGISEVFSNLKDSMTLCCYLKMNLLAPVLKSVDPELSQSERPGAIESEHPIPHQQHQMWWQYLSSKALLGASGSICLQGTRAEWDIC